VWRDGSTVYFWVFGADVDLADSVCQIYANTVDLRLRIELLKRGSSTPEAWLPESPTVRVGYDQQAEVQFNDGRQQPLHITLTAERLDRTGGE
jgi:hypothetical protein